MAKMNKEDILENVDQLIKDCKAVLNNISSFESDVQDIQYTLQDFLNAIKNGEFDEENESPDMDEVIK